jgi:hypothetical protein
MAQKKQNTRRSLQESVAKIYEAGILVNAGFIVGFDSEESSIADGMIACIEDTAIPVCMVGLLYALPTTQMTRRLLLEGRLFPDDPTNAGDQCTAGLNFNTNRPRRQVLGDYRAILKAIYDPAAYFGRVRRVGRMLKRSRSHRMVSGDLRSFARLLWRIPNAGPGVRKQLLNTLLDRVIHNPRALPYLVMISALYLHLGPFARQVISEIDGQIQDVELGRWHAPVALQASEKALLRA